MGCPHPRGRSPLQSPRSRRRYAECHARLTPRTARVVVVACLLGLPLLGGLPTLPIPAFFPLSGRPPCLSLLRLAVGAGSPNIFSIAAVADISEDPKVGAAE